MTCIQVLASKLPTNAKFQNLHNLNSRTFQGFSTTFKHLICFQALSRALKFLFQIQAFSRISQACHESCLLYVDGEHRCSWRLFQMTGAVTWKLRLPTVAILSTARSLRPAEWRRAEPLTTTTRHLPYFSSSAGQYHDRISEVHNALQCHQRKEPRP